MPNDPIQRLSGTRWIANEEPKLTELIIDRETVVRQLEFYPRFCDVIGNRIGDFRAIEGSNVIAKNAPRNALWKRDELPRPIVHANINQLHW